MVEKNEKWDRFRRWLRGSRRPEGYGIDLETQKNFEAVKVEIQLRNLLK